jgi:hypothetical protein
MPSDRRHPDPRWPYGSRGVNRTKPCRTSIEKLLTCRLVDQFNPLGAPRPSMRAGETEDFRMHLSRRSLLVGAGSLAASAVLRPRLARAAGGQKVLRLQTRQILARGEGPLLQTGIVASTAARLWRRFRAKAPRWRPWPDWTRSCFCGEPQPAGAPRSTARPGRSDRHDEGLYLGHAG